MPKAAGCTAVRRTATEGTDVLVGLSGGRGWNVVDGGQMVQLVVDGGAPAVGAGLDFPFVGGRLQKHQWCGEGGRGGDKIHVCSFAPRLRPLRETDPGIVDRSC